MHTYTVVLCRPDALLCLQGISQNRKGDDIIGTWLKGSGYTRLTFVRGCTKHCTCLITQVVTIEDPKAKPDSGKVVRVAGHSICNSSRVLISFNIWTMLWSVN